MSDNQDARFSSESLLADLRRALEDDHERTDNDFANLDVGRAERTGTPEIIYAENKEPYQVVELVKRMVNKNRTVLVSRVSGDVLSILHEQFVDVEIEHPDGSTMVRVSEKGQSRPAPQGKVAIFTAGTSDLARAHEVRMVASEVGSEVRIWADIGVAGLHRLVRPFREAIDWDADVLVVVAGMDGALPSVISGLSPVPVIGLPVSVGYGFGGGGQGALMSMLQTCAPGLTVVNIDNSVGAGVAAARIARLSSR